MPTLVFLIIASVGFYTIRVLLRAVMRYEGYTRQLGALTLAFGFSGIWFFSFLGPIAVARGFKIEFDLFVIIFATSIGVWILSYFIGLFLFTHFEKSRK
jgi:NO-binding membrane sensor protein with MHYT domain